MAKQTYAGEKVNNFGSSMYQGIEQPKPAKVGPHKSLKNNIFKNNNKRYDFSVFLFKRYV
jgi:hypothetical protein